MGDLTLVVVAGAVLIGGYQAATSLFFRAEEFQRWYGRTTDRLVQALKEAKAGAKEDSQKRQLDQRIKNWVDYPAGSKRFLRVAALWTFICTTSATAGLTWLAVIYPWPNPSWANVGPGLLFLVSIVFAGLLTSSLVGYHKATRGFETAEKYVARYSLEEFAKDFDGTFPPWEK